jgi:hypothetical protein
MKCTNILLWSKTNSFRLNRTLQLVSEKANEHATSKGVGLESAILRTSKDNMILATTQEALRHRRRRESSKKQVIIPIGRNSWQRKFTNGLSGTRDLTRGRSSKTGTTHVMEKLMKLRIDLGGAKGQRQGVMNVEVVDLLIKP